MDAANFEQFLQERIKVNSKAGNLSGGVVTIEQSKQEQDHCHFRGAFLQKVFEISHQRIFEEEQSPRLVARCCQQQREL
ncbi:60S ribosomal protein L22 [Lemmus lemmus]